MRQSGFTLVELAIVMVIIGLLIGGILKGQELIVTARVNKTITQIKGYTAAANLFREKYNSLPGDSQNAKMQIPGCDTSASCFSGDGNGVLGTVDAQPWMHINAAINSENTQFWKHLSYADLITGIDPAATALAWGESHPSAAFAGGFHVRTSAYNPNYRNITGRILVLRSTVDGTWICGGGGGAGSGGTGVCAIDPLSAAQIDRKMDDGTANTGFVTAGSANTFSNGCGAPNLGTNGPTGYDESSEIRNCDMFIKF